MSAPPATMRRRRNGSSSSVKRDQDRHQRSRSHQDRGARWPGVANGKSQANLRCAGRYQPHGEERQEFPAVDAVSRDRGCRDESWKRPRLSHACAKVSAVRSLAAHSSRRRHHAWMLSACRVYNSANAIASWELSSRAPRLCAQRSCLS
jgi:hypothetical protein